MKTEKTNGGKYLVSVNQFVHERWGLFSSLCSQDEEGAVFSVQPQAKLSASLSIHIFHKVGRINQQGETIFHNISMNRHPYLGGKKNKTFVPYWIWQK